MGFASESASAQRPLVKRYAGVVRLAHWLNAVFLVGMIASGLQIYNAYAHFGLRDHPLALPNPLDGQAIPQWALLGGWLAGGLNWHFALAWPFVITGLVYLGFLAVSGEWRSLLFRPRDFGPRDAALLPGGGKTSPQESTTRPKSASPSSGARAMATLTGFAIYKPVQLAWLTALFGGYELTRYWHFLSVWLFVGFTLLHVALVFLVDPASLRGMITGWYRGRFPSHD